jgi:hypothetical protein
VLSKKGTLESALVVGVLLFMGRDGLATTHPI